MKKLKDSYNIDNDLKSYIIYKNFESDKIVKDTAMFLEVKKGFDLFNLLIQIKQNAKIINNMYLENNTIKLPKMIIGIMCNFNEDQALSRYEKLKDYSKLQHILDIINDNKIAVLIGAIKDGKINDYDLNTEDFGMTLDSGEKSDKRIDLSILNKFALNNKYTNEKVEEFIDKLKGKYKSLTYEKKFILNNSQLSSTSIEENKKLKQKIKKLKEEKKKMEEEKIKMIEEEKKKMEEKLKKEMEEEKKKMEEEKKKMEEEKKKMEEKLKKEMEEEKKRKEKEKEKDQHK